MSLSLLVIGTLVNTPARMESGSGPYVAARLRVRAGDDELSLVVYSPSVAEALMGHRQGDAIAVAGRGRLRTRTDAGLPHQGISIVAEAIISHYIVDRRRQRARSVSESDDGEAPRRAAAAELDRVARAQAAAGTAQVLTTGEAPL